MVASCCSTDDISVSPFEEDGVERVIEIPMPVFNVNTNGLTIVDEPKVAADFTMIEDGENLYSGNMGIEIRGSSSQLFSKKSYVLETWNDEANHKTLVRNVLIYDLARERNHYANRTQFVGLSINEESKGL